MKIPLPLALAALLCAAAPVHAANPNTDYITPDEMLSPNKAYGVLVPVFHMDAADEPDARRNKVIEVATARAVAVLAGDPPAYDRSLNHHGMGNPHWSKDSSLLLWIVGGKWGPTALDLLKIGSDRQALWQLDLLHAAQQAILARTREAAPEKYAAVKKAAAGGNWVYPDGFTIDVNTGSDVASWSSTLQDVTTGSTVALPLTVHVDLTANPKGIEDYPANLDSYLDAEVTKDGKFVVKTFHPGPRPQ